MSETEEPISWGQTVESTKEKIEAKQKAAENATPDGMELLGWTLDGWLSPYTLLDAKARPVYGFPVEEK